MADNLFILEPETVESVGNVFEGLSDAIDGISDGIRGLDTGTSEAHLIGDAPSFDVDVKSALNATADNIKKLGIHIYNVYMYMHNVVLNHTSLQVKLEFKDLTPEEEESETPETSQDQYGNPFAAAAGVAAADNASNGSGNKGNNKKNIKADQKKPIDAIFTKVGYVYPQEDILSEESKNFFNRVQYDENGYAKVGDRYVVACDYTVGNVGEVLRFTQKTGEILECVIGITTRNEENKNVLNFVVDDSKSYVIPNRVTLSILWNNDEIENIGDISKAGTYHLPPDEEIAPGHYKNLNTISEV